LTGDDDRLGFHVKIREQIVGFGERRIQLIPQTEIKRQAAVHLPVVLHVKTVRFLQPDALGTADTARVLRDQTEQQIS
jgi:hypothetical protein